MSKILVIVNTRAGRAKWRCPQKTITQKLQAMGMDYQIMPPPKEGETLDFVEISKKYHFDTILIAGGDGTIRRVLENLFFAGIPKKIVVYPIGSANVFCKMHGIPQSLDYITDPGEKPLGVCVLNQKHVFLIAAIFGKSAKMTIDAHGLGKHFFGAVSYLMAALFSIFSFSKKEILLNGNRYQCHSILLLSTEFSQNVLPQTLREKNQLTGVFLFDNNLFQFFRILREIFFQKIHPAHARIQSGEKIRFSGDFGAMLHVDGDPVRLSESDFFAEYNSAAFTLLVPKDRR